MATIIGVKPKEVKEQVEELITEYDQRQSGIRIIRAAGGYLFAVSPEMSEHVCQLYKPKYNSLSNAAVETLAVIAYRQPVTRAEIEKIRGVNADKIVSSLHEKGLIKELGKKEAPGRPILYGTTREFLMYFGINSLEELPEWWNSKK
jgi:segregation and condensation protein B